MDKNKQLIIKIDYKEYAMRGGCSPSDVLNVINSLVEVSSTYIDGEYIYQPKEDIPTLELKFIASKYFRKITEEELENKEIKDLKNSLDYARREKERILKEKTCIENELKVLKGEAEEDKKEVVK